MDSRAALLLLLPLLAPFPRASAQQAREHPPVHADADVKVEALPGTSGKALQTFVAKIAEPISAIQRCHRSLVAERPDAVGTLTVELTLAEKGKLQVRAPSATGALTPMQACVDLAFANVDLRKVPRPAAVRITFDLKAVTARP